MGDNTNRSVGRVRPTECKKLVSTCPQCGKSFKRWFTPVACDVCGTERPHCKNPLVEGENFCAVHLKGRPFSLYTAVMEQGLQALLEEEIQADERSVTEEYHLARIALRRVLEQMRDDDNEIKKSIVVECVKCGHKGQKVICPECHEEVIVRTIDYAKVVNIVSTFMKIATDRKKLEDGEVLNLKFDDKVRHSIRQRMARVLNAFKTVLPKYVDDDTYNKIFSEVKELTRSSMKTGLNISGKAKVVDGRIVPGDDE